MNAPSSRALGALFAALVLLSSAPAQTSSPAPKPRGIPEALKGWEQWATWDDKFRDCPPFYTDGKARQCFWPSRLGLQADKTGARFELHLTAYAETWIPLPGGTDAWPAEVKANGNTLPVLERNGLPAVRVVPGNWKVEGTYRWAEMPQRLVLPKEIGILALSIDGKTIDAPVWDASGTLWLKRDGSTEETDKDFISGKVHAQLEDGIPLWWRVEIDLVVSGKSREEEFGHIIPEGWKIATAEGPLPMAIDDSGQLKVQVRAGKWTLKVEAFRSDNPKEIKYAAGVTPATPDQLVAFQARPDFRLVEVTGAPSIDVSQTTFPERWRALPVYRWETKGALKLEERQRGMGQLKPAGLVIARELWLDENGRGLTFRDRLNGQQQQTWRLDAAPGQDLGSVRNAGRGQLITRNPQTKAPGVEIRTRNLALEATGRMARASGFSATGWAVDADSLSATLHLPPGWRLFALFGADYVRGDWLTAWTLLDLFLVLIFTLAVFRLFGLAASAVALVGFVLSYHEPDAPRLLWLGLLAVVALLKYAPEGWMQKTAKVLRVVVALFLLLVLVPFIIQQVQQTIYPQLEITRSTSYRLPVGALADGPAAPAAPPVLDARPGNVDREASESAGEEAKDGDKTQQEYRATLPQQQQQQQSRITLGGTVSSGGVARSKQAALRQSYASNENLQFDAKARIQTGPGVPEWTWRTATFGWNGPVQAPQEVHPIYIPLWLQRIITIVRVGLLLALVGLLLGVKQLVGRVGGSLAKAAPLLVLALALGLTPATARAEFPDESMLKSLRDRLNEVPDAFPRAAEIPMVTLSVSERRLVMEAEIHVGARCAVPLPGRLPAWSPLSVQVDGKPEVALRREGGSLWVVLGEGIHKVRVEGLVSEAADWEWTYQLRPRRVKVESAEWTWTGIKPDGTPDAQIFFTRKQKSAPTSAGAAAYDRKDFQAIVQVERTIEFGLQWQVRTRVTRLSPGGKAVALRIPLLPGESVLTAGAVVKDGVIDVRLGAGQQAFEWESGMEPVEKLELATRPGDLWVERWQILPSPMWNVKLAGLPPVFEAGNADLVPVWQPWPGESVQLGLGRPEAIPGATVTVRRASHEIEPGDRVRKSKLTLALNCSLGEDFAITLPAAAEVTALSSNGRSLPVRKDGAKVIIPLRPGEQNIVLEWKLAEPFSTSIRAEEVKLPVEASNITTILTLRPEKRWPLWVSGPQRGPAIRFWGILLCAAFAAFVLGRVPQSPMSAPEWFLLCVGLTQASVLGALFVIAWLFCLAWRGHEWFQSLGRANYNFAQVGLVALTVTSLVILVAAVSSGLLGTPEMFITGNGSGSYSLRWSQARGETALPQPGVVTVSIWWYRLFMLLWALWLAAALLKWLRWGWKNVNVGGFFRPAPPKVVLVPPPLPAAVSAAPTAPTTPADAGGAGKPEAPAGA